jgi:uncharacterized membrane protein
MLAVIGLVLYVIAAILQLTSKYTDKVIWLVIIGGALVAIDVAWGWRRAGPGYYRRPAR